MYKRQGLDSTLALLVAARAMDKLGRPRSDIIAVTMPGLGTTRRTKSNAEVLAQRLGADLQRIDITRAVMNHFEDIGHDAQQKDVTFENAQARAVSYTHLDVYKRQS